MLRHRRPTARVAALVALAAVLAGCGIKGPLTAPPKPEASGAPTGAPQDSRTPKPETKP